MRAICVVPIVAVLAACALAGPVASPASAQQGAITSDGAFALDGVGEESTPATLTAFEGTIECNASAYTGAAVGGGELASGAEAVTLTPAYEGCLFAEALPTTVTMNGCDYVLSLGDETGEDEFGLEADLVCPEEKYVVVDIYVSPTSHSNNAVYCSLIYESQTGLTGLTATDLTDGTLTVGGVLEGISGEKLGACGEEAGEADLHLAATLAGTSAAEAATDISLSTVDNGAIEADGPFTLDGAVAGGSGNSLTAFGTTLNCAESTYSGEAEGGGDLEPGAEAFTASVTPGTQPCSYESKPATITMNGCDYRFDLGGATGEDSFALSADLVCTAESYVVVDLFSGKAAHENKIVSCSYVFEAQAGLTGATLVDLTDGTLTLGGSLEGLSGERFGACGAAETEEAKLDLALILEGTDDEGEETGLTLFPEHEAETEHETTTLDQDFGALTADGPFTLTGEDEEGVNPGFYFHKGDEAPVTCAEAHYLGEAHGGGDLEGAVTSTTITPSYGNCIFVGAFPMHVDTSNCDYDLDLGGTVAEDLYSATVGVTGSCTIRIYLSKEATEGESVFCAMTIGEQSGLEGATVKDETNGHLTLGGEVEGIHIQRSGPCGEEASTTGVLELAATVEGLDAEGGETPVSISEEEEE